MVTIFDFNAKPDYSKLITDLTEDVSLLLASDATSHKLEETSGNLEKNVCNMSMASTLLSKLGKDVSELSSPGSTLSETAKGMPEFVGFPFYFRHSIFLAMIPFAGLFSEMFDDRDPNKSKARLTPLADETNDCGMGFEKRRTISCLFTAYSFDNAAQNLRIE